VERALHWANAVLFLVLMATGAALYVGPLSAVVGRRDLVRTVHVYCGLALPVPIIVALAGRWRTRLRADLSALNRWDADDWLWLRTLGRDPTVRLGKFNAGQKLNAAFVAGAIPVMLATGTVMRWFHPFPVDWRTGATFVHDWTAIGLYVAVFVHVVKALSDGVGLRGMVAGEVPAAWAERHRPKWHEDMGTQASR
jgi:formate dehydrogenase subunit gamma